MFSSSESSEKTDVDSSSSSEVLAEFVKKSRSLNRFSGYSIDNGGGKGDGSPYRITLDETGPSYLVVPPHPDYLSPQPYIWREKAVSLSVIGRIKKKD